ncbi:Protein STAY-GREEN, chloroplastic [Morella rubra]|uniref:Protein STAY-GREEN, chloroplastic n=1 Tax=Morella rubra TaxID=262757 RepID=A0A6A1WJJ6_9ROSI|nr:Protein STAY-GREEN, chloroplastic [Morella rubra]
MARIPASSFVSDATTLSVTAILKFLQGWYNRLERDEVVAEWKKVKGKMPLHVHCHISEGHFLRGSEGLFPLRWQLVQTTLIDAICIESSACDILWLSNCLDAYSIAVVVVVVAAAAAVMMRWCCY